MKQAVRGSKQTKNKIKASLSRLAFGNANDAVHLLYLDDPDSAVISEMDLFNVAELKRGKGGMEVKFFDRFEAMKLLNQFFDQENLPENPAQSFYHALAQGLEPLAPQNEAVDHH